MKSDGDLRDEIRDELSKQRGSRADELDVQVMQGVVTLTGQLPNEREKWALRDALSDMPGVEGVIDETMIAPEPSPRSPDGDTARAWFPGD